MAGSARPLAERSFRAGKDYELVVFDRLPPEEQILLAELREDAGFYGILRPRADSGRTIRTVDRDTALLWLGAQAPGPLPFFVWESPGTAVDAERRVTQLVLDGVLEVAIDNEYVSGAQALSTLLPYEPRSASSRLTQLSQDALRFGESLELEDPEELAGRLYTFGSVPLTPAWTRRLRGSADVLAYLDMAPGSELHGRVAAQFKTAPEVENGSWLSWSGPAQRTPRPNEGIYKLYVSPRPQDLPHAFRELVAVLADHEHLQFKVGASAVGVLRADKLVVYFESEESMKRVADNLAARLASVVPQGVPFSADIALGGLLSWGMDPPRNSRALAWQGHDSWRLWIVRRLATAMIAAQRDDVHDITAAEYAIERLQLDGVDVDAWTPTNRTWWLE